MVRDSIQLETTINTISHEYLLEFTLEYGMPEMLHPELPGPGDRIVDFPEGKFGWMSFSKRSGKNTPQCYTKPLDSLKNLNNRFFWVDERVFPTVVDWRTNASKDGMPVNGTYSIEAVRALDTHRTPIQKQPKINGPIQFDSCPKSYKGKDWEPPSCPYEVPLLTLTASWVIEMDEPAVATDSSGVPSAIEKSPLDFAHEDGASDQGTAALEMPPPEDVPANAAPGVGQDEEAVVTEPSVVRESHKRGHDGVDANSPTKSLRRDYTDLRPSGSSHGGKSLAATQLCLASNVFVSEGAPANVSDPDLLSYAVAPSHHPVDVAQSSQGIAAVGDPESKNVSSPVEVGSPGSVSHGELSQQVASLKEQVSGEEKLKAAFEEFKRYEDEWVERWCAKLDARPDALSIDFDEELYLHMLTAIAGYGWVVGYGLRLAMMKCAESLEMRQAFADMVSARVVKEGIKLSDAITANISHGEKKKKCRIVCRTHGVGSAHHAKSDDVPVFVPTVVPQGLALLLVDAVTQTDLEDA
nr:hypothetical protein [Tanacetum cinerariifolium]